MSDYIVTLRGHVVESKRPADWPPIIEDMVFVRADTPDELAKQVNNYTAAYVRLQGMTVRKDAHSVEDFSVLNGRMFVPFHMLTHLDAEFKQITGKMPVFGKEGYLDEDHEQTVKN